MKHFSYIAELKKSIHLLEEEQANKEKDLSEQFYEAYESLKPLNLLKSTIHDFISSPSLTEGSLNATMGIAAGLVSRKIIVGSSNNPFRKLIGSLVQLGITQKITQNPDKIKSIGHYLLNNILGKEKES
jgi:hypothetical protein